MMGYKREQYSEVMARMNLAENAGYCWATPSG